MRRLLGTSLAGNFSMLAEQRGWSSGVHTASPAGDTARTQPEQKGIDWAPDIHLIGQVLKDALCASIMDRVRALMLPGVATGPSGQPLPWDSGTWEPSVATDLATRCEALHHLDILTLRVKVYICTTKTGAELQQWLAECVAALHGANALLLKCCIRIQSGDMAVGNFEFLPPERKQQDWAGVGEPPLAGYRTSLVFLDDDPQESNTFVGRTKRAGGSDTAGYAKCPLGVNGVFRHYGGVAAVWLPIAKAVAHEIGHNAGLACEVSGAPQGAIHRGYSSDIHVMGVAPEDPPGVDQDKAGFGMDWTSLDCVTLRLFAIGGPPVWPVRT